MPVADCGCATPIRHHQPDPVGAGGVSPLREPTRGADAPAPSVVKPRLSRGYANETYRKSPFWQEGLKLPEGFSAFGRIQLADMAVALGADADAGRTHLSDTLKLASAPRVARTTPTWPLNLT